MGQSEYSCGVKCIRWFFVGCNAFFMGVGILNFALGVWGLAVSDDREDVITGDSNVTTPAIVLVTGIIIFILALFGLLGGIFMARFLLIIYAIALGLIILLELIAVIFSFVYSNNVRSTVRDRMEDAVSNYRLQTNSTEYDQDVNDAVEEVQDTFSCCGVDNSSDWVTLNRDAVVENGGVPPGDCECDPDEDDDCVLFVFGGQSSVKYVWKDGCLTKLVDTIKIVSIVQGAVGIIFLLIELAFLAIAIGLTVTIFKARSNTIV